MGTEKCYNPTDPNLKFVDKDEHDFLYMGYSSASALMSCGHSVTPGSLKDWCEHQLNQGKIQYECGVCKAVWPFDEVSKMALLTDEEKITFEEKRFQNIAFKDRRAKSCPNCEAYVLRQNPDNLRVRCRRCRTQKGKTYEFCWDCLREWKGSSSCGNEGCVNPPLETLKTCPEIKFKSVKDVTGCPSVRACPTCGVLVSHNTKRCKNIVCAECSVEFCFVCLKVTEECLKTSTHYEPCSDGVAPRQTSIPTKK